LIVDGAAILAQCVTECAVGRIARRGTHSACADRS
jgi:hypothetical protein